MIDGLKRLWNKLCAVAKKVTAWVSVRFFSLFGKSFKKINLNVIVRFYALLIIVPMLLMTVLLTYYAVNRSQRDELENANELLDSVAITTQTNMDNIVNLSAMLCYDTEIMGFLSQPYSASDYYTYNEKILSRVHTVQVATGSAVSQFSVYMKNETIPEGYGIFRHFDKSEKLEFFEESISTLKGNWVLYGEGAEKRIYYVQGIYNFYGDELLALLTMEMSADMLIPQNVYGMAEVWISDGDVIYTSTSESMPNFEGETKRFGKHIAVKESISELDVTVVLRVDRNASLGYITAFIVLFVCFMAVAIIMYFILLYRVIRDANRMIAQIQSTVDNDFKGYVSTESRFELSIIAEKFNDIVEQIHLLIDDGVEKNLAQRDAQITAMQCQINPHMLCNSLQIVQYHLERNGQYEISDMVAVLGKIMRYGIDDKSIHTSIKMEIEHLQSYIEFQRYRMNPSELEFEVSVDKRLKDIKMLRLVLQPIVENAIRHGKPKGRPIKITVKVEKHDDSIKFLISNTGVKLSDEDIEKMQKLINAPQSESDSKSIGLQNINHRLILFYSQSSGLKVGRTDEGNTLISFQIPCNFGEGNRADI